MIDIPTPTCNNSPMNFLCPTCGHAVDTPMHELGCGDDRTCGQRAEEASALINSYLGVSGAAPDFPLTGHDSGSRDYTGRVVISEGSTQKLLNLLEDSKKLRSIVRELRGDLDAMRARMRTAPRRQQADLAVEVSVTERLLGRLT